MNPSPTPKYRMWFGAGSLLFTEIVVIARLFQEIGDWHAIKRAVAESATMPITRIACHSVSSEVRRGKF